MAASTTDSTRDNASNVNFVCQKCGELLKLEPSFLSSGDGGLNDHIYSELTAPMTRTSSKQNESDKVETDLYLEYDSSADVKQVVPSRYASSESGNGFTLLERSYHLPDNDYGRRLQFSADLFDILSGQSEVDHPLCDECTDALLDQLDKQLKTTEDECEDYQVFLEKLNSQTELLDEAALYEELRQLDIEEDYLKKQLNDVEQERIVVDRQIEEETSKCQALKQEEERYYREVNEYKRQVMEYDDAKQSVENQLHYARKQFNRLKMTNVFNTTFHIWHNGQFGTINGFRLGRLPNVPVDWNEINCAWGQTVLLLHSLAKKINLKFKRYRLIPNGNYSHLECLTDKSKELPLHVTGGFKFFWDTKFDQAMVAFLDCVQQFKEEVEKGETKFSLPYRIEKGRIEDTSTGTFYSIKIQFNSEEQWTKALKFMLTNLKWGLTWVSSQFSYK